MMRLAVGVIGGLLLVGCASNEATSGCDWNGHHYAFGEQFPDDCNTCTCTADVGVWCTDVLCLPHPDANPASCLPDLACSAGPSCGAYCCGPGERCANDVCVCGSGPACGDGDTCAAAGPAGPEGCGAICCGASGPCPQ